MSLTWLDEHRWFVIDQQVEFEKPGLADSQKDPDRWEVGTWSTLHLASNTLLYA